jgi:hypothetical protein
MFPETSWVVLFNNGDDTMATSANALNSRAFTSNTLYDAFNTPARAQQAGNFAQRASRNYIPQRPSLLNRLFAAMVIMRQRQAERAIANYLATTGGKLTDSIEREIQRRLD